MSTPTASPLPALSAPSLAALREINESALTLLSDIAHDYAAEPGDFSLPFIARRVLQNAGVHERAQLADIPALLVDIEFRHAEWWQQVAMRPTRFADPAGPRHVTRRRALRSLTRAALAYAWNIVHQDRPGAQIVLGMSTGVIEVIAGIGPVQMQQIADRSLWHLRPRWHDRPALWRHLLRPHARPESARLARIQCLQQLDARALHTTS
jgi:hypothetical protein